MQKTYTIAEACSALSVSARTLHGWMKKAGVQPEQSPIDYREHVLTAQTVKHLATLHGVTIGDESQVKASEPASRTVKQLKAEVAALESRVSELQSQLETLSSEFREFMDDVSSRLARPSEQPTFLKPPKPEYQSSGTTEEQHGLPPGSITMRQFAVKHKPLTRDWLMPLIKKGDIPSRSIPYGYQGKEQPWFLPEHLSVIVAYIRDHPQIPFGRCDDPACPCHA